MAEFQRTAFRRSIALILIIIVPIIRSPTFWRQFSNQRRQFVLISKPNGVQVKQDSANWTVTPVKIRFTRINYENCQNITPMGPRFILKPKLRILPPASLGHSAGRLLVKQSLCHDIISVLNEFACPYFHFYLRALLLCFRPSRRGRFLPVMLCLN